MGNRRYRLLDSHLGIEIAVRSVVLHDSQEPLERHLALVWANHPHLAPNLIIEEYELRSSRSVPVERLRELAAEGVSP